MPSSKSSAAIMRAATAFCWTTEKNIPACSVSAAMEFTAAISKMPCFPPTRNCLPALYSLSIKSGVKSVRQALFTEEKYRPVSTDAKMLYGLLLDRMHLSLKNGWVDKQNRIYQFFTVREAQEKLRFGHEKICRLFSELEQADLIVRKRQGQGKPSLIYVKKF